jgi:ribonuclease HII
MLKFVVSDQMTENLFIADAFYLRDTKWLIGVDEVGRGPLAGPVMAAAVAIDGDALNDLAADPAFAEATDSKKMRPEKRLLIYQLLLEKIFPGGGIQCDVAMASVEEIAQRNILGATKLAMARALIGLETRISTPLTRNEALTSLPLFSQKDTLAPRVLIDGKPLQAFPFAHDAIVKGDQKHMCIALASIAAKVERDAWMRDASPEGDPYGWEQNKGYGTRAHIEAIRRLGPHPLHRTGFLSRIISEQS